MRVFDNEILAQIIRLNCAIGEVTSPAKDMPEAFPINSRRSICYGFDWLLAALKYRWAKIQDEGHSFRAHNGDVPSSNNRHEG
jgi:hypothetical protein